MPQISVVVDARPPFADPAGLRRCLASLAAQTLSTRCFEVLLLDPPATGPQLAPGCADLDVRTLSTNAGRRGAARNVAVAQASGRWTTFLDAGCHVSPDYLELLLDAARVPRAPVAVPVARVVTPDGILAEPTSGVVPAHLMLEVATARAGKLWPTSWLTETPFADGVDDGVESGVESAVDLVHAGHLFSRFDRRFTGFDTAPAREGATCHVTTTAGTAGADSRPDDDRLARSRVAVLSELVRSTQQDALDRSPMTVALLEHLGLGAGGRIGSGPSPPPSPPGSTFAHFAASSRVSTPLLLVAGSATAVNEHGKLLSHLSRAGAVITVVHYRGRLTDRVGKIGAAHRIGVLPTGIAWLQDHPTQVPARSRRVLDRVAREGLRVGRRLAPEVLPARASSPAFTRIDRAAAALITDAPLVLAVDREGESIARAYGRAPDVEHVRCAHHLATRVLELASGRVGATREDAIALRLASRLLRSDAPRTGTALSPALWTMSAHRLQRAARLEAAGQLLDDCSVLFGADRRRSAGYAAVATLQQVLRGAGLAATPADEAREESEVIEAARETLRAADEALDRDLEQTAFLTTAALDLLFARPLHTARTRSALVSSPSTFLAPLTASRTGALLAATTPPPAPPELTARRAPGPPRVTVIPGAYPKFAAAVVGQLTGHADVEVLDLAAREKRFTNTAVDPVTVRERLLGATGHPPTADLATREALSADVVFVDWADKGLAWATQLVPTGTRVVVRLHGVDTLSAWLHTAQWHKVDDVIFPSEHLRRATVAALGDRLDHVRQHVVANPVDVDRYVLPKLPGAEKTLGMVGWAQQVKDPLWTLDLLDELRRTDPEWRLALIGADLPVNSTNAVERAAARAFRERVGQPGTSDAVDFVGYTRQLPEHLRRVGWAVSSSRREGFHIGLVEMAASGAVPVVRDWPVYAGIGGASTLFPESWVSHTPAGAAERIRRLSVDGQWSAESRSTVETVRSRFSGGDSGAELRRIILGAVQSAGAPVPQP